MGRSTTWRRGELPADLGYELRTPIDSILGTADALLTGDLSPEQRRGVEAIRTSGESLLTLLKELHGLPEIPACVATGGGAVVPRQIPDACRPCMVAPTTAVDPVCLARLHELDRVGTGSVVADVVESFVTEMPRRLEQIREAVARGDRLAVGHLAHSLKGGCLLIGALRLAEHCSALEEQVRSATLLLVLDLFAALQAEAVQVSAALAPYRPAAAFAEPAHPTALDL